VDENGEGWTFWYDIPLGKAIREGEGVYSTLLYPFSIRLLSTISVDLRNRLPACQMKMRNKRILEKSIQADFNLVSLSDEKFPCHKLYLEGKI